MLGDRNLINRPLPMRNFKFGTVPVNHRISEDDLFRVIFDESPDAIFLLQVSDFSIIDCNPKALSLFESEDKSSLIGKQAFQLYESEPVEFSKNIFIENINKGEEHSQELAFRSLKGNIFWGRCAIRKAVSGDNPVVVLRVRRVVDYMKTAEMLATMIKKTSKTTGYAYFEVLTELLSKAFNVNTVMIAQVDVQSKTAESIRCWHKSEPIDSLKFNLETSPSLNVLRGYPTFYPRNLKEMFPEDKLIRQLGVEGYLGTPIYSTSGEVSALLILMDENPMEEIPNSRYVLSIFASRAGAELERIQVEEAYRKQISELEKRTLLSKSCS